MMLIARVHVVRVRGHVVLVQVEIWNNLRTVTSGLLTMQRLEKSFDRRHSVTHQFHEALLMTRSRNARIE